jgi:AcrR family transcriptional regulator
MARSMTASGSCEIASRLFATHGYDGFAARHRREAQITKAALYYHFPNKEALHQHIVIRNMQALIDRVSAAVKQAGSATGKMRAFMLASADFYSDRRTAGGGLERLLVGSARIARRRQPARRHEKLLRACIAKALRQASSARSMPRSPVACCRR